MNIFKKFLSYLWDIRIEERSSDINELLIVFLSKGRYQLCTRDAIYSHDDKYYNFKEILENHIDYNKIENKNALVLGLGMGSIPIILDQLDPGQWKITGVEIDEVVIELATKYTFPRIQSSIQTIVGDAMIFVDTHQEKYDLICIDLFIDQEIPDQFQTTDFLRKVKLLLSSHGIVIYNTIAFTADDQKEGELFFNHTFLPVFPQGRAIKAHRNLMLLSS